MWKSVTLVSRLSVDQTMTPHAYSRFHRLFNRGLMTKTSNPFDSRASEVIDVRSPIEYEKDHIPGALTFPVLTDEQRTHVGQTYGQDSFQARKIGAVMVSSNISDHISSYFVHKPPQYQPLIYCWRGGQRSGSLAMVLSQIGFEVLVLEGGYKTYRRRVVSDLQHLPRSFKFIMLSGLTGCGKTHLLHTLQETGAQVLDLEGLARHKGSLLGLWHQHSQPSQKLWESRLRHCLANFDPTIPVWVESESSKVGKLSIPSDLFNQMREADRFEVWLPLEQRVKNILKEYSHWMEDVSALKSMLLPLKKVRGQATLNSWFQLAEEKRWEEFVEQLLLQHYDSTYETSQKKNDWSHKKRTVTLEDLSDESLMKFVNMVSDATKSSV